MRSARKMRGWSQEDLAHESGIHRTYISDLERAARNPTISIVEKIAVALGLSAADLIARE
ncbi:helix-turn-helix domain-containing protein [Cognatishimia sp.]|uniref:helix-turn-helix domain-containing protein n=1 Tax=Cognatishimia sp. TaxID=2211648 RepID=UPI0035112999|nr:helix-turn-helix transcriptional regulator [Cognatishimia sp.]